MGTPVTAATQTTPIPPAPPPATHTLLPTTWVIPSGGTGLFPKAEHQMLKGEENYAPWSNIFLTAVETIGCKQSFSGVIPCPDPVLHPTEYGVWQSGYTVDEGFASAILVTTLPNNPNTPGSWHTWISNFSLTSATTIASTVAQILGSYRSAHSDKSGDSGTSNVDSAITTVEGALLAKGKYFCQNCLTQGHTIDYCRQPGGGKHNPNSNQGGKGKNKGKKKGKD
ncbi:hypothetical protein BT96DRAFT_980888 [Gymnopus androsaceus JB14]|uniref:Uncharacterized protein n=1 Tax=Gymnopus androsaceus JB14 TaxID=1447944 RepID=A0A6A4GTW8_9AGAR|nr:hypothetical protein BT96DRAFT_980888 [Gymnopus androsaceus JB14]